MLPPVRVQLTKGEEFPEAEGLGPHTRWRETNIQGQGWSATANGITIDPGCCTGDHVMYEALLRRPARKDRQCPRGRHIQVWRCPPVRRQPLLSQALREDRRSRRPSQAEERRREAPENRRGREEAPRGGQDVKERPAAIVSDRRRFLESVTGKTLSDSTV